MANITLHGNPFNTIGELPKVGNQAPDFELVKNDLSRVTLKDFLGNNIVLNIFPSIDTGTCAASVRAFNKSAAGLENTKVLNISRDLPFAQARFCGVEGINDAITLSDYVNGNFGKNYNLVIADGPLESLLSRVVIIVNKEGKIIYSEQVSEIVNEPNYEAALKSLK